MNNYNKIKSFRDLNTWQKSYQLILEIYNLTDKFPRKEMYILVSQMRRCALSIASNIAEGFTRISKNEKRRFYNISIGSIVELQNQLIVSQGLKYIDKAEVNKLYKDLETIYKMTNGLIRSLNRTK